MTRIEIAGRTVRLDTNHVIGQGGEATIYRLGADQALKLYKSPADPEYATSPAQQAAARIRLREQQHKLLAFPADMPSEVVGPIDLAYQAGVVVGFTMSRVENMDVLMQYGNRSWRDASGIDANRVVQMFRQLHKVVAAVHQKGVVIGDFNDLNVMTDSDAVRLVDADSMQFGGFNCQTYTSRFLDPLLADTDALVLSSPHNENSDWYAFFVMLMQSLLYVGPYGGVHRPRAGARLQHDQRVLKRLTLLDDDVVYPKPALPFGLLPDDMQRYFEQVTKYDQRGVFPADQFDNLRFTGCTSCGVYHARSVCPQCSAPGAVRQVVTVRGEVTAHRVFRTEGKIVQAAMQNGALRYLYQEGESIYRENDRRLMNATLSPELRFRLCGDQTLIGHGATLLTVDADGDEVSRQTIDQYQQRLPMFDTNSSAAFWLQNGQLVQTARLGNRYIGDILPSQTVFWVGERLGCGFYRAGQLVRGFVFTPDRRGINDQVDIEIRGQLVDAMAAVTDSRAWIFTTTKEKDQLQHRVQVVDASGCVLARASAESGEDSWLGHGIRGHLATGTALFVATDDGLVRLTVDGDSVVIERTFPDTEPFVRSGNHLLPGPGGIYVVSHRDITLLTIR